MNPQLVLEFGGFVVVVGGIIWSMAFSNGQSAEIESNITKKIDQHIADDERVENGLKSQLTKLWEWKDLHEKEAANMRLELQKQIGKIEAGLVIHDGHYAEILRLIASMQVALTEKIAKLEEQIARINKN